jgi:hypothetical protein
LEATVFEADTDLMALAGRQVIVGIDERAARIPVQGGGL